MNSFDITGITQSNQERFHSALKHVLTSTDTSVAILDDLDGTEDLAETFIDDDDVEYLDEDEDEDALSDALSESSDSSSEDEATQINQMSENEDQQIQDGRNPADITHPNTEYEEDIKLIQEHRASRKRKNTLPEPTNKRKRSNDEELVEPQRKKALSNLTNTDASTNHHHHTRSQARN